MSDLTIYKGRTWRRRLTVTDLSGVRQNLTGATIEFRVKHHARDADPPVIGLLVGSGITLLAQTGSTLGQADLVVPDTASVLIPDAIYVGTAVVTLSGEVVPQVVVPPTKIPIRDLP